MAHHEVIIIPRSFKLLEELEEAEKDKGVPAPHAGWISLGLSDSNDFSLTHWNASVFGPAGTSLAERIYTISITAPEDYPRSPPKFRFVTKINMENVDQKTGDVHPKMFKDQWKINSSMALMLCHIRNNMKSAARLPQPAEGSEY